MKSFVKKFIFVYKFKWFYYWFSSPFLFMFMMKFWFFISVGISNSIFNWFIFNFSLCFYCSCCFWSCYSYYTSCKLSLTITLYTYWWSFFFFYFYLYSYWSGFMLFFFYKKKSLNSSSNYFIIINKNCIYGVNFPLSAKNHFEGPTVITNLLSAIPLSGNLIVNWIWGGFSVGNATLNRFYSFHFFFPFILIFLIFFHLLFLHIDGSSNSLGLNNTYDKIKFYPYYLLKDYMGFMFFFFFFIIIIFFNPLILSDSENFIMANSLITPIHIQPEWYYLFAYAILRSITSKLGGVMALFFSILILLIMLFLKSKFNGLMFYPILKIMFFFFFFIVLILTWLGSKQVEYPYLMLGSLMTFYFMIMNFTYKLLCWCLSLYFKL
uniref:Cytochrome b n=1 Tax=Aleurodicus dispersus TaxID=267823 RepID=U5IJ18_9HEMI|nr:cytochrome b [Aleurodicus dispersus]ALD62466.1 cytochrome b [Aleurodicus dispersus]